LEQLQYIKVLRIVWLVDLPQYFSNVPTTYSPASLFRQYTSSKKWQAICAVLTKLDGLQDLRILLFKDRPEPLRETKLLKPLAGLQVAGGKVTVELPFVSFWNEGDGLLGSKNNETLGFRIQRRRDGADPIPRMCCMGWLMPQHLPWHQLIVYWAYIGAGISIDALGRVYKNLSLVKTQVVVHVAKKMVGLII
jgi:hypothetical protein